jgi:hypothetical protein
MKTYTKTLLTLLIFSLIGGTVCKAATVSVSYSGQETFGNAFDCFADNQSMLIKLANDDELVKAWTILDKANELITALPDNTTGLNKFFGSAQGYTQRYACVRTCSFSKRKFVVHKM